MLEQYVSSYIMLLLCAFYVFGHISTSINSCYHFSACLVNAAAAWKKNEEKKNLFSLTLVFLFPRIRLQFAGNKMTAVFTDIHNR